MNVPAMKPLSVLAVVLMCSLSGCGRDKGTASQGPRRASETAGTVSVPPPGAVDDHGWRVAETATHSIRFPAAFAEYATSLGSGDRLQGLTCKLSSGYELNVVRSRDPKGRGESDFLAQYAAGFRKQGDHITGPFVYKGYRAVHVRSSSARRFCESRVVYANGMIFLLTAEGPKGRDGALENNIARFFDSLEIK